MRLKLLFAIFRLIVTASLVCYVLLQVCLQPSMAQQMSSLQATGDSEALAIVRSSLAALSGSSKWASTGAAHLIGTMSVPSGNSTITFPVEWEDIWREREIWYLHKLGTGDSERDLIQSPAHRRTLRREDKSLVPIGKTSTLPPVEIPGALFAVVLGDPNCSVRTVIQPNKEIANHKKLVYVRIDCAAPNVSGGSSSQIWAFSSDTHLPSSVSVVRKDMLHAGVQFTEVVHFKHYRTVDGLLIPDICKLTMGGMTRTVTLQTIEFPNPSQFPKSDFEVSK